METVMVKQKSIDPGFEYQLSLIKIEMEMIERTIARMDEITQSIKNWAIVTWAGSVAVLLREPTLRKFIILTIVLPIMFWYSDAIWRQLQKRSIYRQEKISKFLNGEDFIESFKQQKLINFVTMDPVGRQYRKSKEFQDALKLKWIMRYKEIRYFYGGLIIISVLLGALFLLEWLGYVQI
jgi:hypothetical protein